LSTDFVPLTMFDVKRLIIHGAAAIGFAIAAAIGIFGASTLWEAITARRLGWGFHLEFGSIDLQGWRVFVIASLMMLFAVGLAVPSVRWFSLRRDGSISLARGVSLCLLMLGITVIGSIVLMAMLWSDH